MNATTATEIVNEHNRRTQYVVDWMKRNGYDEWVAHCDRGKVIDMCLSLLGCALGERVPAHSTTALLSGDLAGAYRHCDDVHVEYLRLYWRWIYNNIPATAVHYFRYKLGKRLTKHEPADFPPSTWEGA